LRPGEALNGSDDQPSADPVDQNSWLLQDAGFLMPAQRIISRLSRVEKNQQSQ